uniref:Uncharacterized protein n=1 Tax=Pithovirus LCPAC304 TaxID=2506594 RepID=A0A481Z7P0_9VIRU|nr:MAG: hypothetical protein LCPAC304_02540 [Pithovirus LCPAC304]
MFVEHAWALNFVGMHVPGSPNGDGGLPGNVFATQLSLIGLPVFAHGLIFMGNDIETMSLLKVGKKTRTA